MDIVIWIIVIVLIVGIVWWLLNRSNSANKGSAAPRRTDGGLSGGSAAASAEAAGTAGLPSAAGFGSAAEPAPPTTADDDAEQPGAPAHHEPVGAPESVGEKNAISGQEADAARDFPVAEPVEPEKTGFPAEAAVAAEPAAAQEPLARQEPPAAREPQAGPGRTTPDEAAARQDAPSSEGSTPRQTEGEWETQWSEAGGAAHPAGHGPAGAAATGTAAAAAGAGAAAAPQAEPAPGPVAEPTGSAHYVHHTEYTDPHAPTLPGAETAAADGLAGDLADGLPGDDSAVDGQESARTADGPAGLKASTGLTASPAGYEPAPEPMGHLAAEHPYGAGSASPGPDGSGPAEYGVKGDAGAMVYYEEGHPDYEQTTAEVWFESAAHAEAAGFRAPRRTRL